MSAGQTGSTENVCVSALSAARLRVSTTVMTHKHEGHNPVSSHAAWTSASRGFSSPQVLCNTSKIVCWQTHKYIKMLIESFWFHRDVWLIKRLYFWFNFLCEIVLLSRLKFGYEVKLNLSLQQSTLYFTHLLVKRYLVKSTRIIKSLKKGWKKWSISSCD